MDPAPALPVIPAVIRAPAPQIGMGGLPPQHALQVPPLVVPAPITRNMFVVIVNLGLPVVVVHGSLTVVALVHTYNQRPAISCVLNFVTKTHKSYYFG